MSLQLLKPVPINTAGQIVSTNVTAPAPESGYPAYALWASGSTTYTALTSYVTYQNRIYQCISTYTATSVITDHVPGTAGSTWWLDTGPVNKWAPFDIQTSTAATSTAATIQYRIKPGSTCNGVAVIGITGAVSVTLNVYLGAGGSPTATYTQTLDNTPIVDWYSYWTADFQVASDVMFGTYPRTDGALGVALAAFSTSEFEIIITRSAASTVSVAGIIVGKSYEIGAVQYGATAGIIDYSVKTTDGFGNTTLVQRNYAKRASYTLTIDNTALRLVHSLLASVRATPCLWVGSDDVSFSPLTVYGFYKDFSINVAYAKKSTYTLEIEGLT